MPTAEQRTAFRHRLAEARRAAGLSQRQLGELVSKSNTTISQYEAGKIAPGGDVCVELESVLELEPGALSQYLGYTVPGSDSVSLEAAIELADHLSPDARRMMLAAAEEGRRINEERRAASDSDV